MFFNCRFKSYFLVIIIMSLVADSSAQTLSAKEIQKAFVPVSDGLYACKYETTNGEFNTFLNWVAAKDSAAYRQYAVDSAKWQDVLSYCQPLVVRYNKHPAFKNFPVVTVSYDAANAYCDWLSSVYNNDLKRQFKKVKFSLPSEEEWNNAAQGGNKNLMYPWGGFYLRNKKGEYLCNFRHISDAFIIGDTAGHPSIMESEYALASANEFPYYTAEVRSFYPNSLGIYNLSGNVAEMTTEKGLTKGGSWNSYGGDVTIAAKKFYQNPSPEVGFRVFMKVIEE